ncbi:MAG TPA: type IV pili methyl-accepting chemotaxis transducer N-terminal domain-containing protein [Rhodocyclaceae bacterium]
MSSGLRFPYAHEPHLSADQLRRRYVVALSLIACLTIASQFLMQLQISDQSYDSRVVNIAGRQRMLSQKITKLAYYVATAAKPDAAAQARSELVDSLDMWQLSHAGLLHGDPSMGLPGKNSDKVIALFDAIEPHYQAVVAAARAVLNAPRQDASFYQAMRELREHEGKFLEGMNEIVFLYDREANAKVAFTRRLEMALMAFTLLVLALEAALIFAPATRRIQRDIHVLAEREQDLRLLFSASPTPLLLVDRENLGILHANQEAVRLFGVPMEELAPAPLSAFVPPELEANRIFFENLATGGMLNKQEASLRDAKRVSIDTLMSVRSIRFSGRPVLVLGITDITEFKKAQQTLAAETRRVEEKNRELALLYETTRDLAEPASREAICRGMLQKLGERLGVCGGAIRLLNPATHELHIVASTNVPEAFLKAEARMPLNACLCGHAASRGISITEATSGTQLDIRVLNNCRKCGYATVAAIPICSKQQALGVMTLFFEQARILASHELRLLEAIGLHLGVVIENLHLVEREKQMAVSEERNLLAQELHDSIAQSLAFLNLQAQMLDESLGKGDVARATAELALMREGVQESYDDVRELLVHFRIRVDQVELQEAIRSTLEKFEGQTGLRTSFVAAKDGVLPSAANAIQVLHILQEALSNVRKHAAASAVEVVVHDGEELRISVRDDGCGFDPQGMAKDGGSHVGIGIMRERAHRIGARLDIDAAPGRGTCVTLILPQGEREGEENGIGGARIAGG